MEWLWGRSQEPAEPSGAPSPVPKKASEANDASVESKNNLWVPIVARTNGKHVFLRRRMEEGSQVWTDRDYKYAKIPPEMVGGTQVSTNHVLPAGTWVELDVKKPATLYLITEKETPQIQGSQEDPRDGRILPTLRAQGWAELDAAPDVVGYRYGQKPQVALRLPVAPGMVRLPTAQLQLTFCIVAVARSSPEPVGVAEDVATVEMQEAVEAHEIAPASSSMEIPSGPQLRYPNLRYVDLAVGMPGALNVAGLSLIERSRFEYDFKLEQEVMSALEKRRLRRAREVPPGCSADVQMASAEAESKEQSANPVLVSAEAVTVAPGDAGDAMLVEPVIVAPEPVNAHETISMDVTSVAMQAANEHGRSNVAAVSCSTTWSCQRCTYLNRSRESCEMCGEVKR
mmetsp:Transcript_1666/g.3140  ORF Transcript_1666/g.3140 Transcript_1666/m.3140 type:complete len:399 (-) Transcript_1666:106-1302(-)